MGNVTKADFDKAVEKIGEYLHKFSGSKPSFSQDTSVPGTWVSTARVTHAAISIEVIVVRFKGEPSIDVILSSGVVKLPNENLVAFFRQLLAWNYVATDVVHYGLDEGQSTIFLLLRRPFEGFDYSEFKDALETISKVYVNGLMMLRQSFRV